MNKKIFFIAVALILSATEIFSQNPQVKTIPFPTKPVRFIDKRPLPNVYLFDSPLRLLPDSIPDEPATEYDTVAAFLTAALQKMVKQPWPDAQNSRARPIPEDSIKLDSILFTRSVNGSYYQLFFGRDIELYWQPSLAVCILFIDGVKAVFNLNSSDEWEPSHGPDQGLLNKKKIAAALEVLQAPNTCLISEKIRSLMGDEKRVWLGCLKSPIEGFDSCHVSISQWTNEIFLGFSKSPELKVFILDETCSDSLGLFTWVLEPLAKAVEKDSCWAIFWKHPSGYIGHGHAIFETEEAALEAAKISVLRISLGTDGPTPVPKDRNTYWAQRMPCSPEKPKK